MTTFSQLVADAATFLARDNLTALMPTFVRLMEDKIDRQLRVLEQHRQTFTRSTSEFASTPVAFTTSERFLEHINLTAINDNGGAIETYQYTPITVFRKIQENTGARDPIYSILDTGEFLEFTQYGAGALVNALPVTDPEIANVGTTLTVSGRLRWRASDPVATFKPLIDMVPGLTIEIDGAGQVRAVLTTDALVFDSGPFASVPLDTWTAFAFTFDTVNLTALIYINGQVFDLLFTDTPADNEVTITNYAIGDVVTGPSNRGDFDLSNFGVVRGFFDFNDPEQVGLFFEPNGTPRDLTESLSEVSRIPPFIWLPSGQDLNQGQARNAVVDSLPKLREETAITGANTIRLLIHPATDDAQLRLEYFEAFPRLSAEVQRNWLIENHYDLYLFGTLAEAYDYIEDFQQEQRYREKFSGAIASIIKTNLRKSRGNGPLRRRNARRASP